MKTSIKARITCLLISRTTIMVNKGEKIYFVISISNKRPSSFFNFISLFFFFPHHIRFNFVISERNVHILFCRHIWAELSFLFLTFLSGTFLPGAWGWGGGGVVHVHPMHPPLAYAPGAVNALTFFKILLPFSVTRSLSIGVCFQVATGFRGCQLLKSF